MSETPQEIVTRWLDVLEAAHGVTLGNTLASHEVREAIRAVLAQLKEVTDERDRYNIEAGHKHGWGRRMEAERDALRAEKPCQMCQNKILELGNEVERLREEGKKALAAGIEASILYNKATARAERAEAALRELVRGIDDWNHAVGQIIERQVNHQWAGLEVARAALRDTAPREAKP